MEVLFYSASNVVISLSWDYTHNVTVVPIFRAGSYLFWLWTKDQVSCFLQAGEAWSLLSREGPWHRILGCFGCWQKVQCVLVLLLLYTCSKMLASFPDLQSQLMRWKACKLLRRMTLGGRWEAWLIASSAHWRCSSPEVPRFPMSFYVGVLPGLPPH